MDNQYGAPNLEAAGLSVNVLRDRRTEKECNRIETGSDPVKTKTINGIHFHYGMTGGAAGGHAKGCMLPELTFVYYPGGPP